MKLGWIDSRSSASSGLSLLLLPLLLLSVAAQDARIPRQNNPDHPSEDQAPIPAAIPSSHPSEPSPIPTTMPITDGKYVKLGKKLFNAVVMGKIPEEDVMLRDERDREDGVERLMKENWDKVANSPKEDVWVMLISGPPRDYIDFRYQDTHKNVTRSTREYRQAGKKGMDHIHFARIDYMREADICTRWLIFRSPVLAIVSDQGKTVRWAPKALVGAGGEFFFDILESEQWKILPVWNSRYAPGGDRAFIIDFYINGWEFISSKTANIPSIVWMGVFAALTQAIVKWMSTPTPRAVPAPATASADGTEKGSVPVVPIASTRERWEEAVKNESGKKGVRAQP